MPEPAPRRSLSPDAPGGGGSPGSVPRETSALDELAQQLRELGAESTTERAVRQTVPWVASLTIHLGVIALAVLVAGTVRLIQQDEQPIIVADFEAMAYEPVTPLQAAPEALDAPRAPEPVEATSLAEDVQRQLEQLELDPAELLGELDSAQPSMSMQPTPADGQVSFVGVSASNARRIVYVIDASGSLISSLQIVVDEMARSLESLQPPQEFSIVFFQQDRALVAPPGTRLLPSDGASKLRAMQWIDRTIIPNGNSNPLPAIEAALRLEPDVIFLLSDNITGGGQYEIDQRRLLARLDELNPRDRRTGRRSTQINCIQFLDPDPLDTLAIIAREHGGADGYKFLDRAELGLSRP